MYPLVTNLKTDKLSLFLSQSTPKIFTKSAVFFNFPFAKVSSLSDIILDNCNEGTFECYNHAD